MFTGKVRPSDVRPAKSARLTFEELYPHAPAGLPDHVKRRSVSLHQYNESLVEGLVPPIPQEHLESYERWRTGREYKSFYDFPEECRRKILSSVSQYEQQYPDTQFDFYLGGSYSTGSWVRKDTPEEERQIRARVKALKEESDIDLIPEPFFGPLYTDGVDINTISKTRGEKIRGGGVWL